MGSGLLWAAGLVSDQQESVSSCSCCSLGELLRFSAPPPDLQKSFCLCFAPFILFSSRLPSMCQARESARVKAEEALLRTPGRDGRN